MNRGDFDKWQKARGPHKVRLMAKMCIDNELLVEKFAVAFMKHTQYAVGHLRDDVFQAARIGLMVAITQWKPHVATFSTFAFFKMRNEMQKVLEHATPISRPRQ